MVRQTIGIAVLLVVLAWLWQAAPAIEEWLRPRSLLCHTKSTCNPPLEAFSYPDIGIAADHNGFEQTVRVWRYRWWDRRTPRLSQEEVGNLWRVISERFALKARVGRAPLSVVVGANDFKEVQFYSSLCASTMGACEFILVEPNELVIPGLRDRSRQLGVPSSQVQIVNAAICPERADTLLHRCSRRLNRDFPSVKLERLDETATMDKDSIMRSIQNFRMFTKIPLIANLSAYIEEVPVRCLTPSDLLAEGNATPASIDVLSVDAEGYDARLMELFLQLEDLSPAVIQFEWAFFHGNNASQLQIFSQVVRKLHSRGYNVHKHGVNIIAIAA